MSVYVHLVPLVSIAMNVSLNLCIVEQVSGSFFAVIDCGGLTNPINGRVMIDGIVFNSVATYTCNKGYTLIGDVTRLCLGTGLWSGNEPTCVEGIYMYIK